jgi:hypothetical protein
MLRGQPNLGESKYLKKDWFTYTTNITASLAPGVSVPTTFNIDGDSDFFCTKLNVHGTVGNDGTVVDSEQLPEVNIIITDTTSGRQLMNALTPLSNIAGSSRLPFILPIERFFSAKSTVKVDWFNASDNLTYTTLLLSFIGIKAFIAG